MMKGAKEFVDAHSCNISMHKNFNTEMDGLSAMVAYQVLGLFSRWLFLHSNWHVASNDKSDNPNVVYHSYHTSACSTDMLSNVILDKLPINAIP